MSLKKHRNYFYLTSSLWYFYCYWPDTFCNSIASPRWPSPKDTDFVTLWIVVSVGRGIVEDSRSERRPSRRFVKTRLRMYCRLAIDHSPTPRRQIKRMSAGKTIPLYLESRERSLPLSAAPRNPLNPWALPRAPLVNPFMSRQPNGSWQFIRY